MSRFASRALAQLVFAAAGLVACASETGTAPTIKDLTVTPQALEVGKQVTLTGSLTFDDADADVTSILAELKAPNGQAQALPAQTLQGASGVKSAPVKLVVALVPNVAGDYTLDVWVRDKEGNDSAKLSQTLTAK